MMIKFPLFVNCALLVALCYTGYSNPDEVVRHPSDLPANESENLILNGDFASGLKHWSVFSNSEHRADFEVVAGELVIDNIDSRGNNGRSHQAIRLVYDLPITLKKGKYYKIQYRASSASPRYVFAGFVARTAGGNDIAAKLSRTNQMDTYEIVYPHTGPTDPKGQLNFFFGGESEAVTIDNIAVYESTDSELYPNLPELLVTEDRQAVTDIATWENVRRPEILRTFTEEKFGPIPDAGDYTASWKVLSESTMPSGKGIHKLIEFTVNGPDGSHSWKNSLYLPKSDEPVPVYIYMKHKASRAMLDPDPSVYSNKKDTIPVESVMFPAGYGLVAYNVGLVADEGGRWDRALVAKFASTHDLRAMSAWVLGGRLLIDYLMTDPDVDVSRIAVTGFSRGGIAAVWFGANDKRISVVYAENGTGLHRHIGYRGVDIDRQVQQNPGWFNLRWQSYVRKEEVLPFDTHQYVSLIAPRGYADGTGATDYDPEGQFLSMVYAQPVWDLYGRLAPGKMYAPTDSHWDPKAVTVLRNGAVEHHVKPGGHLFNDTSWKVLLDFAEHYYANYKIPFVPKPNRKYHITNMSQGYRLAANGSDEQAYMAPADASGPDVEWQFTQEGSSWHIDRAASGKHPRLGFVKSAHGIRMNRLDAASNLSVWAFTETAGGRYTLYNPNFGNYLQTNTLGGTPQIVDAASGAEHYWVITEVPEL